MTAGRSAAFRAMAAGLAGVSLAVVVEAQGSDTVTVRVVVPASYNLDAAGSRRLLGVTAELPWTVVRNPYDGDISNAIVGYYNFGQSNRPVFYSELVREVLAINKLTAISEARAGPLLLPTLPQMAKERPGWGSLLDPTSKKYRLQADSVEILMVQGGATVTGTVFFDETRSIMPEGPSAPQAGEMEFRMPLQKALALVRSVNAASSLTGARASIASGAVSITLDSLASDPPLTASTWLAPAEVAAVVRHLRRGAQRRATVYVLDAGWASEAERAVSAAALVRLMNHIRTGYHLGDSVAMPTFPAFRAPRDSNHSPPHVEQIAAAIAPLRALDSLGRIETVFVPLARDQGSELILEPLLETFSLLHKYGRNASRTAVPESTLQAVRRDARHEVAGMSTSYSFSGLSFLSARNVLSALWNLADFVAVDADEPYVLSTSWLVENAAFAPTIALSPAGVLVAATGNFCQRFLELRLDLAQASVPPSKTVSVLDYRSRSRKCSAAPLDEADLDNTAAVGYEGSGSRGSGTSIATPRVAWFIALDAISRPAGQRASQWSNTLVRRLMASRTANDFRGIWLDVTRFPRP